MPYDRAKQALMQQIAAESNLTPWDEVAAQWNLRSGENLSRSRVWQIAMTAEKKLRQRLEPLAKELGVIK